jgi:hypothetical protein
MQESSYRHAAGDEIMGHCRAMAKRPRQDPSLRAYAVIGAEQRLLQIAEEARAIFKVFPELRGPNRGFGARSDGESPFPWERQAAEGGGFVGNGRRRRRNGRRRRMSVAARKRISEAQKARWAKLKARGAKKGQARRKQGE